MIKKMMSRKLWMTIAGIVAILATDYATYGRVHAETLGLVTAAVIGYCVSQGWVDGKAEEKA